MPQPVFFSFHSVIPLLSIFLLPSSANEALRHLSLFSGTEKPAATPREQNYLDTFTFYCAGLRVAECAILNLENHLLYISYCNVWNTLRRSCFVGGQHSAWQTKTHLNSN